MRIQQQSGASVFIAGRENDKQFKEHKKEKHQGKFDKKKKEKKEEKEGKEEKKEKKKDKATPPPNYSSVVVKGDLQQVDLALALIDGVSINFYDKTQKFTKKVAGVTSVFIQSSGTFDQCVKFTSYSRMPLSIKYINVERFSPVLIERSKAEEMNHLSLVPNSISTGQHVIISALNIEKKLYHEAGNINTISNWKYSSNFVQKLTDQVKDLAKLTCPLKFKLTLGKLFFYQLPDYIQRNNNCLPFQTFASIFDREIETATNEIRVLLNEEDPSSPMDHSAKVQKLDIRYAFDDNLSKHLQTKIISKLNPDRSVKKNILSIQVANKKEGKLAVIRFEMQLGDFVTAKFKSVKYLPTPMMNVYQLGVGSDTQRCDYLISCAQESTIEDDFTDIINQVSAITEKPSNISEMIDNIKEIFAESHLLVHEYLLDSITIEQKFVFLWDHPSEDVFTTTNSTEHSHPFKLSLTYIQHHCSQHSSVTRYQWRFNVSNQTSGQETPDEIVEQTILPLIQIAELIR